MKALTLVTGTALLLASTPAFSQYPPPQSSLDQRCRQIAEATLFSVPNPERLALEDHGYRIWASCMRQAGVRVPSRRPTQYRG